MKLTRFIGVGVIGFAIQIAALALLRRSGCPDAAAITIAVELAILQNFIWHERWTWKDRQVTRLAELTRRFLRFNAACGMVSLAGNVWLTLAFATTFRVPLLAANALAVATLSVVNFAVADRLVFRRVDLF
jgi:dolichol-phosphate mannosyltransferase